MFFSDVIGHKDIKKYLINLANEKKLIPSLMFLGEEGSGNLALAVAYAQYLNCLDKKNGESCGICSNCRKINKLIHPDIHFVFPVNSGKKSLKDPVSDDYLAEWRQFFLSNPYATENNWYDFIGLENKQGFISATESRNIIRKLNLKAFEAEYKIMIIWLPERMNVAAANILLKIIEEPPEKTLFFLVANSTDNILPTIISRQQIIHLKKIDDISLTEALISKHNIPGSEIPSLLKIANGNYGKLLELINNNDDDNVLLERFKKLTRSAYQNNIQAIFEITEEFADLGREKQKRFLSYCLYMLRENVIMNFKKEDLIFLKKEEYEFSKNFHPFVIKNNEKIYKLFNDAYNDIEANGNPRIIMFDLCLKLHDLLKK